MFISPNRLIIVNSGFNQYTVRLEPLEQGIGHTIGVVFRKIFLSFLNGYTITHVRFTKILNEFTGCKGIKEDIVDVLNNLRKVRFILVGCSELNLSITKTGVAHVLAGDFFVSPNIVVFNPKQLIATITEFFSITIEVRLNKGYGYQFKNYQKFTFEEVGSNWICLSSSYSPVLSVVFKVEPFFLKGFSYDSLIMTYVTNGTVDPKKCFYEASYILLKQVPFFFTTSIFTEKKEFSECSSTSSNAQQFINNNSELLSKRVDELNLSVRSLNCLKLGKIFFLSDLLKKSENDLLNIVNFGKKSLLEVKDALNTFGLKLTVDDDVQLKM